MVLQSIQCFVFEPVKLIVIYLVGSVSCKAHVDAVGNIAVALNHNDGVILKPAGGGYSAPVKNLSICPRDSSKLLSV